MPRTVPPVRLGADPHQLEVLARSMRSAACELLAISAAHDTRLRALRWDGSAAAVRLDEFRIELGAGLRSCSTELVDASRRLDGHALEQRSASLAAVGRVTLWIDPTGDGRLVERVGPADASVVVVLVPGVGTDLADRSELRSDAERVWATVAAVHERDRGDPDVAVVSWLGYDPPDHVWGGLQRGPATTGARRLVDDVATLRSAGAIRIVVVGHSYGAVVASLAGAAGLDADELVLVGSPGLGVDRIDQLRLRPGARVWAAAAPRDPVAWVARAGLVHGPDPVAEARRLATSRHGHGAYLEDPVLLTALGTLAAGGDPTISPGPR